MLLNVSALSDVIFFILLKKYGPQVRVLISCNLYIIQIFLALLHFRTPPPPIVIDDSSWENVAESFTIALTLTLGGYESGIAPYSLRV